MIVCKQCGQRNQNAAKFCANPACGAFLEWEGDQVETGAIPRVQAGVRPGRSEHPAARESKGAGLGRQHGGVAAFLSERELSVEPGSAVRCQIRVRNAGPIVDQFSVHIRGDAAAWASVEPKIVNLYPAGEETVHITFSPPRASSVVAGPKPFQVQVSSKENPASSAVDGGTVKVGAFHEVSSKLVPTKSAGRLQANHDLIIDSRGNAPITAVVSASDPDRALAFSITPAVVSVMPGGRRNARVQVRPRKSLFTGMSRTHPFEVLAELEHGDRSRVDGTMVQAALFPTVTRGSSLALRVLLTLIGGLMMIGGASMEWLGGVAGTGLNYDEYVQSAFGVSVPEPPAALPTILTSVGLLAMVLGAFAILGVLSRTGRATRVAAGFALLFFAGLFITLLRAGGSLGFGAVVVIVGSVIALIGGLLGHFTSS